MTNEMERRAAELEVRATKNRQLEGYAAVFNERAKIADFEELILPGAFGATLRDQPNADILALVDHDPRSLLGRRRNRSLDLSEDTRGLHFRIALAYDILALAEAGSLGGASFGFKALKEQWTGTLRTLKAIDLREVSIVRSFPAYEGTVVHARSRVPDSPLARRLRLLELESGQ